MPEPIKLPILRLNSAGTPPEANEAGPKPGRWKLVSSEDGLNFLYVPEAQQLFSVPSKVAELIDHEVSHGDDSEAVDELVRHLLERESPRPLTTARARHDGLKSLVIHVSQLCNLDCTYCYAHDLNQAEKRMTLEVAAQVAGMAQKLATSGLGSVKYLGGEPTLAWEIIEWLTQEFVRAADERQQEHPTFVIVTNGTKLEDRMISFMRRYKFHALVSIDGQSDIHDLLRPRKDGSGSYTAASNSVVRLKSGGVDTAIEAVYTRAHYLKGVTPLSMMSHFRTLGVREFQISLAVGDWHAEDLIPEISDVAELFATACRQSVRSLRTTEPFLLRGIQFVLAGFALREKRTHVCGAGRHFMAVNYDGEAFPCYLLESKDTSYGFLTKDWDSVRYEQVRSQFENNGKGHHAACRKCWANEICQSCLGPSFQLVSRVAKPPAWFCKFQKETIGATLGEIAAARSSSDWAVFVANMERLLAPIVKRNVAPARAGEVHDSRPSSQGAESSA